MANAKESPIKMFCKRHDAGESATTLKTSARDKHKLLFYFFMFYGKVLVRFAQCHFYCEWICLCAWKLSNFFFFIVVVVVHSFGSRFGECNINNVQIVSVFHPCYKSSLVKCVHECLDKKEKHTQIDRQRERDVCALIVCGWLQHCK